jgi:hypothetical protein
MSQDKQAPFLKSLAGLVCGAIFGVGLSLSEMINPLKVIGFLDVLGNWDPSLAFVMGGALIVATLGYRFTSRRQAPSLMPSFEIPVLKAIDKPLLAGAVLFGVGWGLVGLCPGPALANMSLAFILGTWKPIVFVAAMMSGMVIHGVLMTDTKE